MKIVYSINFVFIGTVTIRLEWREPNSDLPVVRYKVFWSRRVKGLNGELDSVLVNYHVVPKVIHLHYIFIITF